MVKHKVSIVKYTSKPGAVRKALEMCGALDKIKKLIPSDKVLLKPNLVMWDSVFAQEFNDNFYKVAKRPGTVKSTM